MNRTRHSAVSTSGAFQDLTGLTVLTGNLCGAFCQQAPAFEVAAISTSASDKDIWAFRNAPISGLIPYLSTEVGHIVMDKTWLAGSYDFILDFVTDRHSAGWARLQDLRSSMH